jgi:hypothetical protein
MTLSFVIRAIAIGCACAIAIKEAIKLVRIGPPGIAPIFLSAIAGGCIIMLLIVRILRNSN